MDIINIIFRCIDFLVIVGLVLYGIKTYIIPAVEKIVREYAVFIYNLESDCKNLQLQSQAILENMQDQDQHFHDLQQRFMVWKKKCHERQVLQQVEHEKIALKMQERYALRSYHVTYDKALQQQVPDIVENAEKILHNAYQEHAAQKQYIDELLDVMKVKS